MTGRPNGSGAGRSSQAAGPRRVALDVLDRVLGQARPFDETFAGHPGLMSLSPRDRAFARLLLTTVLRRLGQIDALLGELLRTPPKDERVRNMLRLGAAQLLFLGTPAHAAVGETVSLAVGRHAFARGLVNAVLRRLSGEGAARLAAQDAARLNTPDWLWQSWREAHGEERARAIAKAHLAEPPLDLTVKEHPEIWAKRLDAERLWERTVRRQAGGQIEELPGYREGAWWVQDVAAALPARLLGEIRERPVIDLCAAPGGKTAQLAAAGARVTAVELSERRAERLRANLKRLQLHAEVVVADAMEWRPPRPGRRGAARCAVHRHGHHPPPSRHPLAQVAGRGRPDGRAAGKAAGRGRRDAGAGRHSRLCELLAPARGRPRADRGVAVGA